MADFDFFDENESFEIQKDIKSNELELSFDFDYNKLLNDGAGKNVKLCATVKPSDELRKFFKKQESIQSTHICLVIDISSSMSIIIDRSNVRKTGKTIVGEDGKVRDLVEGGISKLDIAVSSAKKVVDLMREGDTLSCIIYDNNAQLLFHNLKQNDRNEILSHLTKIADYRGGETNITKALTLADEMLSKYEDALPKRVIFFTDGSPTGDDSESKGIKAGKNLADHNITVDCMGFGSEDVNFEYLQKISSFSGGLSNLISYPDQFTSVFSSLFEQAQSVVITNVRLILKLTAGTKILDYYRGTPDNVYLGNFENSDDKILELNLGQIEENRMYKYYFNVDLSGVGSDYEGIINTMTAELRFFVPSMHNNTEQIVKENVTIYYTSNESETEEINGEVNVNFRLAEVKKLDEEREIAYTKKDKNEVIRLLQKVIDIFTELQKPNETENYSEVLKEYMRTNSISNKVLNKAVSSSSQAQELGILDELESETKSKFASRLKSRRLKK